MLLRWQVAISAAFFILATMCVKYTVAEARHETGIDLDRLALVTLNFGAQGWEESRARGAIERVMEIARAETMIEATAVSAGLPFGPSGLTVAVSLPGQPPIRAENGWDVIRGIAGAPSLFRVLGIPILRGRAFDDRDQAAAAPVVVLSQRTARALFGVADPIGRQVVIQSRFTRQASTTTAGVIGVARDTDGGRVSAREHVIYFPLAQRYAPNVVLTARTLGDPFAAVRSLRDAVRRADPDLAVETAGTGRTVLTPGGIAFRAAGLLALSLGALTLLLAMIGLYGIQAHVVGNRTRETGVRMSLGATPRRIKRMVLVDGYRPVVEGLAIGLFIGFAGRAIVRAYLVTRIDILDPWILALVPIPLVLAAFFACYLPAQRAAQVDPYTALRSL